MKIKSKTRMIPSSKKGVFFIDKYMYDISYVFTYLRNKNERGATCLCDKFTLPMFEASISLTIEMMAISS